MTTCLGVIPQNDLHRIANRTDIAEFIEQGDRDLQSALKVAQAIVHNRHRLSRDVKLHCAFDIRTVWHEVANYASRTPAATAAITQWQQDIRRDIDIDRFLSMADSTLRKYSQYIDRIQLAWKRMVWFPKADRIMQSALSPDDSSDYDSTVHMIKHKRLCIN